MTYIGQDLPTGWVICHYGVKGMKWGKVKKKFKDLFKKPTKFTEEYEETRKYDRELDDYQRRNNVKYKDNPDYADTPGHRMGLAKLRYQRESGMLKAALRNHELLREGRDRINEIKDENSGTISRKHYRDPEKIKASKHAKKLIRAYKQVDAETNKPVKYKDRYTYVEETPRRRKRR